MSYMLIPTLSWKITHGKMQYVKYLHTRHGENAASTLADSCHSGDGKENKMIQAFMNLVNECINDERIT